MTRSRSALSTTLLACLSAIPSVACLQPTLAQTRVDLRSRQSPHKDQGSRGTCIKFASVAALEAAYMRAGHPNIDLSEEFASFVGKMFWLHPNWNHGNVRDQLSRKTSNWTENQVGAFGGGSGTDSLFQMKSMRIPREAAMPYQLAPYDVGPHTNPSSLFWNYQKNANDFNLDPKHLPRKALTAAAYFGPDELVVLTGSKPRNPVEIERVLRMGIEVVWDFRVGGFMRDNTIWQPDPRVPIPSNAHSMLIVGYDRSSTNPKQHYFIVKNSWGRPELPRGNGTMKHDGFTYISYDYLRTYGSSALYVKSVKKPAPWPELAFVGRRNISYDGWRGTLDIYHLPGMSQHFFKIHKLGITDRRLGTLTTHDGKVYRVNGEVQGDKLVFWFNSQNPHNRWDERRVEDGKERRFVYYTINRLSGKIAGYHHSNKGVIANPAYGGYARVPSTIHGTNGFLSSVANPVKNAPEQFLGQWKVHFDSTAGYLNVLYRDDLRLHSNLRPDWAGLVAEFHEIGTNIRHPLIVQVSKSRLAEVRFTFLHSVRRQVVLGGYMLSWERGVFAGIGTSNGRGTGVYGARLGTGSHPGVLGRSGSGCTGSNGKVLTMSAAGSPFLGRTVSYRCKNALPNAKAIFVIGRRATGLGIDLAGIGAPGCKLFLLPDVMEHRAFGPTGVSARSMTYPNDRALIGTSFYSQYAAIDLRANRAGLTTSNAYWTKIGGPK